MTTQQISLRLKDETVAYLDEQIRAGRTKSRASYIDRLLTRERRREQSIHEIDKLTAMNDDPEIQALGDWVSTQVQQPSADMPEAS